LNNKNVQQVTTVGMKRKVDKDKTGVFVDLI